MSEIHFVDILWILPRLALNNLFFRMIPFEEISLQELNKCLQKFLSARKSDGRGRSVITRQNCNRW